MSAGTLEYKHQMYNKRFCMDRDTKRHMREESLIRETKRKYGMLSSPPEFEYSILINHDTEYLVIHVISEGEESPEREFFMFSYAFDCYNTRKMKERQYLRFRAGKYNQKIPVTILQYYTSEDLDMIKSSTIKVDDMDKANEVSPHDISMSKDDTLDAISNAMLKLDDTVWKLPGAVVTHQRIDPYPLPILAHRFSGTYALGCGGHSDLAPTSSEYKKESILNKLRNETKQFINKWKEK